MEKVSEKGKSVTGSPVFITGIIFIISSALVYFLAEVFKAELTAGFFCMPVTGFLFLILGFILPKTNWNLFWQGLMIGLAIGMVAVLMVY